MTAYYNEFEPYAAEWLENLIAAGHLPAGARAETLLLHARAAAEQAKHGGPG